ncbi:MAG: hypothetical protein KGI27_14290 [Thaumarchaeota archaeon]|nr:hypothetical protein [Nitrososphaerota archaeon]
MTLCSKCLESEEYIDTLKEQLEEKSRLVNALTEMIRDKDRALLFYHELDEK